MINGVLVERTVKDVKPVLQTNSEGLKKVLDDLVKQYKGMQDDMEKWKVRLYGYDLQSSFLRADARNRRRTISKSFSSDAWDARGLRHRYL